MIFQRLRAQSTTLNSFLILTSSCFCNRDEAGREADVPPCPPQICYTDFFPCLQIPRVLQSHRSVKAQGHGWGGTPSERILILTPAKRSCDLCWERAKQLPGTGGMPRVRLDRQSPLEGQELGLSPKNPWLRATAWHGASTELPGS